MSAIGKRPLAFAGRTTRASRRKPFSPGAVRKVCSSTRSPSTSTARGAGDTLAGSTFGRLTLVGAGGAASVFGEPSFEAGLLDADLGVANGFDAGCFSAPKQASTSER